MFPTRKRATHLPPTWTAPCSNTAAIGGVGLVMLLLLGGCAGSALSPSQERTPAPIILHVEKCPLPAVPRLPPLKGVFLESGKGYAVLKYRDELMRRYIKGLQAALDCYEKQLEKNPND